jgi:hypothetical protein
VGDNLRAFPDLYRETIGWDDHLLYLVPARDNVQTGSGIWTQRWGATTGVQVQVAGQGRQKSAIIVPANLDARKIVGVERDGG